MLTINHDLVLGVGLGGLMGFLLLPTFYAVSRWTWRVSPFMSAALTAFIAAIITSVVVGALSIGLALPAHPWVADWNYFTFIYRCSVLVGAIIVTLIIHHRARDTSSPGPKPW
jgi:riboflavin transporter FmnP